MASEQSSFVQRTLRRAIFLPVAGAVIVAVVFLAMIERLLQETDRFNHSEEVIASAEQIRQVATDMETGIRGYLLSNDPRFLEPYNTAAKAFGPSLRNLETLVSDNPEQRRLAVIIGRDVVEWQRHAREMMTRSEPVERQLSTSKVMMDRTRSDFDQFLKAERALSANRAARVRTMTLVVVILTLAVAFIAAAISMVFVRRDLAAVRDRYEAALDAAAHAVLIKDNLLATVSHELRTPLTSILGWASILKSHRADEETEALALTSIEQSARLQARLVEDLIDVSRAASGKLRVEMSEIDLRQPLRAAVETIRPAADSKGVDVQTSIPEKELKVNGDAARLQQVFWNFLTNAVRFTPSGGQIHVFATSEDGFAVVRIRDTGAGIAPEFLPRVFEPFAQQRESSARSTGLGLGLSISQRLVELHGGRIEVRSEGPGKGAEFTVRLPAYLTGRTPVTQ